MQDRGAGNIFDVVARANPEYVESLHREFQRDPASVDPAWAMFFAGFEFAGARDRGDDPRAADLKHSYRELGHLVADLDPLGRSPREHPLVPAGERADADLVTALKETYCGTLGVEYLDIADKARREWLEERMESSRNRAALTPEEKVAILERLIAAETFEQFLQARYPGLKRFSLEGGEALIPLLDAVIEEAAGLGAVEMVMGMPHRGRLNVLAHTLGKPYELILAEFDGTLPPADVAGDGDVKYHLGYSRDYRTPKGRAIHLSLSSNPSHLEAINSVVEGIVRAKQAYRDDRDRTAVVPVVMHGDAAFMGQGSVYETLAMSELPGFTTGGTVHVIVNNQIGFTTDPADYVFTRYPSDPAKVIRAPVFHVNGDDPEAVVQAARLATGYRQAFHADAFVDFFCYRRYGHNEQDDPTFTQPALYRQIAAHPPVTQRYAERLRGDGVVDEAAVARIREAARSALDGALARARERKPRQRVFAFGGVWKGFTWAGDDRSARTAVPAEQLRLVADALHRTPDGFHPHRRLPALLDERHERVVRGEGIDWATGEMLAYGSLLLEGTTIRLSGQDSVRGTFSHRHAVLFDAETGDPYVPLNHLGSAQAPFEAVNSLLSEFAALGFEYGVSSADPRRLVLWEAQFGDFVNGAQVIVDQFIASAESKWQRMSGLVLLLPHGYEGQGPEHSSGRLERFLQLCAEDNMQVVNATTPAQFFHVLRRQIHRPFRKPLVVMTPKSLLRHPAAVSRLTDLTDGAFQLVLGDPRAPDPAGVRRVLLGSGKIFYALDAARQEYGRDGVAIVRVEQLYPFPAAELASALGGYRRLADVCWVQEEPANQGGWTFVRPRIEVLLAGRASLRYIGRDEAASPATGSHERHRAEEQEILEQALAPIDARVAA